MKRKLLLIIFYSLIVLCLSKVHVAAGYSRDDDFSPKLQIPIISDIHIKSDGASENFSRALKDYKAIEPKYKAIAIVGDITNRGMENEYDDFLKIMNEYTNPEAERIIVMGNHEFFEGKDNPRPELTDEAMIKRFTDKTKMPGLYFDKWVAGYHFIVIGGEKSRITDSSYGDHAMISEEQYKWLKKTISINASPAKPIFLFLHQPIDDTVYGSSEWGAGLKDGRLYNLLKKYPQVIMFSGHSHFAVNHPRTVYQNGFTMVNTGAVSYSCFEGGNIETLSQGLLVNVFDDRVEINTRDFSSGKTIRVYKINLPYREKINDNEKPYFSGNAYVQNTSPSTAVISLDSAKDNIMVEKYYVKYRDEIIKTVYTEFWKDNDTGKINIGIESLKTEAEYPFKIYAVDGWNNISSNPLEVKVYIQKPKI